MLLYRLEKAHAKFQRQRSLNQDPHKSLGHALAHSISRSLKDDLEEQHKLHIRHKIWLLTLSPKRIHGITKDMEDLGISHKTARRVLIMNGYDYDKAITQLIDHVLKTLDFEERQLTSLAIARLIDPGDTLLDMDCVLEAMLRSPKGRPKWKVLAGIIEDALMERKALMGQRKKILETRIWERALLDLNGDVFNVEQD